jgi:hypothetical protein
VPLRTALLFAAVAIVMNSMALAAVAKRPLSHVVVIGVAGCVVTGVLAVAIREE